MPEIHLVGFGTKTEQTRKKVREFLIDELDRFVGQQVDMNIRDRVLDGAVIVCHPNTYAKMLVSNKSATYIMIQSTDHIKSNLLMQLLKEMPDRPDLVQGQLVGFYLGS